MTIDQQLLINSLFLGNRQIHYIFKHPSLAHFFQSSFQNSSRSQRVVQSAVMIKIRKS